MQADLDADRQDMVRLAGHLPDSPGAERFAKYYDRNPHGQPLVVLAREPATSRVVGMAALLPTPLRIAGEAVPAAIGADFAIEPEYRGLGPALALQRASLELLADHGFTCAYGCPNPLSEPIVKRVGYENVGSLTRYLKVLETRLVVDRYVHRPRLARLLRWGSAPTLDPLLRLVSRERRTRGDSLSFERPPRFDERFRDLWEAVSRRRPITGERSAEHLNWKYGLDTGSPSEYAIFAAAEAGGRIAGYVVYRLKHRVRHVLDIACFDSRPAIDALVGEFLADARSERASGVTFLSLGPLGLVGDRLRSFGFLSFTEDKRLRVYPGNLPESINPLDSSSWHFVMGDDDF